jgi:acetoacetyl-CoA reductase
MSRIALVTGGTRGIGKGISIELKNKGYTVIASYAGNHDAAKLFQAETSIATVSFDVANEHACRESCENIIKDYGSIDVLVHNAGVTADAMLLKMTSDQWHKVVSTNLDSAFYMTRAVLDSMKTRNFGRLIYLSSVNGLKGQRGQVNYAATKAALIGFAKSVALEMANKGVTANVIAPGYIDTEMVRAVPAPILEKIIAQIPVGRLGTVEEIAHIVSFLADERSGFITGSTLSANGGMY